MADRLCFTIGPTAVAVQDETPDRALELAPAYRPFLSSGRADINLTVQRGRPDLGLANKIFQTPPIWSMYRGNGLTFISLLEDFPDRAHTLRLPDAHGNAAIYFAAETAVRPDPFQGPAIELLSVNHLADGRGCILHGCGIDVDGSGILFAGESGTGKSTLSHLWAASPGAAVLSDDRTIASADRTGIRIFGTPWHGEAAYGSPAGCRLKGLFFLRHDRSNRMRPLPRPRIVQRLLTCSFPPLWDRAGMEATLDFFDRLSAEVPACELGFVPGQGVIDAVRQWLADRRG